jgi:hypothetical protein
MCQAQLSQQRGSTYEKLQVCQSSLSQPRGSPQGCVPPVCQKLLTASDIYSTACWLTARHHAEMSSRCRLSVTIFPIVDPVTSGLPSIHARSAHFGLVAVSLRVQQTAADSHPDP